jgi:hypothetical protein
VISTSEAFEVQNHMKVFAVVSFVAATQNVRNNTLLSQLLYAPYSCAHSCRVDFALESKAENTAHCHPALLMLRSYNMLNCTQHWC